MKIAYILSSFPVVSETFILHQICGLLESGHDVRIFAQRNNDQVVHDEVERYELLSRTTFEPHRDSNKLFRIIRAVPWIVRGLIKAPSYVLQTLNFLKFGQSAWNLRLFYSAIPHLLIKENFDVIHCHFGPVGIQATNLRSIGILKAPIVVTMHAYDIVQVPQSMEDDYYKDMFAEAERILTVSEYMRQKVILLGAEPARVFVHHVGVDCSSSACSVKKVHSDEPVQLVSVGRLIEKKGMKYSIQAINKVRGAFPDRDIKLIIAGDGVEKEKLSKLIADLQLQNTVELIGSLRHDKVLELLKCSHIFILHSITTDDGDQEGTPTVILEAMAMGLPVVSTHHSGILEQIDDKVNGYLVPERDVDAFADTLIRLIENQQKWPEIRRAAWERVDDQFNIQTLNRCLVQKHFKEVRDSGLVTIQPQLNEKTVQNSMGPLVTVVIPTYNRAHLLGRALQSVLDQTIQDIEIVVVDDNSDDDPSLVIQTMQDKRVRLLRLNHGSNAAIARNVGSQSARGQYLAFLDSDDEWLPNHLESKIKIIEETGVPGVVGAFYVVDRNNVLLKQKLSSCSGYENFANWLCSSSGDARTSTFVFRTKYFREVRFDKCLRKHQDWDLALRFHKKNSLTVDKEPTVKIHIHENNRMSHKSDHNSSAYFLEKNIALIDAESEAVFLYRFMIATYKVEGKTEHFYNYARLLHKKGTAATLIPYLACRLLLNGFTEFCCVRLWRTYRRANRFKQKFQCKPDPLSAIPEAQSCTSTQPVK